MFPFGHNPYGSSYQSYDPYDQLRLQQELQRRRQAQEYARQRQLEELNRRRAAQLEYARREAELQRRREAEALRQRQLELEARRRKLSEPARPRGIGVRGPGYRNSMFDGGVQDLFDALYGRPRARSPSPSTPGRRSASSAPKTARSPEPEPKSKVRFAPDDQSAVSDGEDDATDNVASKGIPITVSAPEEPMDTTETDQVDSSPSRKAVNDILAKFATLKSGFTFPEQLDFLPSPDGVSTPTPKLAYTPNNAPLHQYEHLLTGLLTQLDAVESYGDAEVRKARKDAVKEIEKELEELDVKKVQDWRKQFEPPVVVEPTSDPAPDVEIARDTSSSTETAPVAQDQASVDPASVPLPENEDRELRMDISPQSRPTTSEPIMADTTPAQPLSSIQAQEGDVEAHSSQPAAVAQSSEDVRPSRSSSPGPDSQPDRTIMTDQQQTPTKPVVETPTVESKGKAGPDEADDDYVNVSSVTKSSTKEEDEDAKIRDDWELNF